MADSQPKVWGPVSLTVFPVRATLENSHNEFQTIGSARESFVKDMRHLPEFEAQLLGRLPLIALRGGGGGKEKREGEQKAKALGPVAPGAG